MKKTKFNSKAFKNIDQQKGWTLWSLLFVIGVLILVLYVGFQLFPLYVSNNSVKKAMQHTMDATSITKVTRRGVVQTMKTKLNLDGLVDVIDYKKDLDIKKTQSGLILTVNYERRVELFYNLSIVASFDNTVEKTAQ